MRSSESVIGFVFVLLCGLSGFAEAQSLEDQAARFALMQTPIGSLAPLSTSSIESEVQRHVMVAVRYGYYQGQLVQKQSFAGTALIPIAFGASLSATAGWSQCIDCGNGGMLGLGVDWRFLQMPIALFGEGRRITAGLRAEGGWGEARGPLLSGGSAWTGSIGLPLGLINMSRPLDTWRFVPFVTPSFNYGSIGERRVSIDGTAWMLGGGLAIYKKTSRVGLNIGAQYIAVRDGDIVFGVGLVLGSR